MLTRDGLQLADTPIPSVLPGRVRLEVRSVGICSTDLAIWKGEIEAKLPIVLGHEIAGTIHESSDESLPVGEFATVEVDFSCGRCWYCTHGMRHHCGSRGVLGITEDGGLSEYITVPVENVHLLPEGVDVDAGTFVEPLASAIEAYERLPAKDSEPVLVVGSGNMGLLVAQVYEVHGALVQIAGYSTRGLGLAKLLGLTHVINAKTEDWRRPVSQVNNGAAPRVVIETSGTAEGISLALKAVRPEGFVALMCMHGAPIAIRPIDVVEREIRLYGISRGPFDKAIDILAKGRIEVKRLVSRYFALDEGAKAFEYAIQPDVQKVIVTV